MPITSSSDEKAEEGAILLAKLFNSQVTILQIIPEEPVSLPEKNYILRESYAPISTATGQFPRTLKVPPQKEYEIPNGVTKEISEQYLDEKQALLAESVTAFNQESIAAQQKIIVSADLVKAIVSEAKAGNYDAVITADNADKLWSKVTSEIVLSKVKISVFVVRTRISRIFKILAPVKGVEDEKEALSKVSLIAKASGSNVVVLYVQPMHRLGMKPKPEGGWPDFVQGFEGGVQYRIVSGDPSKRIIQTAIEEEIDLVVMSKGRSRLRESSLGSVANSVLHETPCSVILVT